MPSDSGDPPWCSKHTCDAIGGISCKKCLDEALGGDPRGLLCTFTPGMETPARMLKWEVAIPLLLHCPLCSARHIDEGEFETLLHHTHACQSCGHVWRPAIGPTVGVRFLPGFRNAGGHAGGLPVPPAKMP